MRGRILLVIGLVVLLTLAGFLGYFLLRAPATCFPSSGNILRSNLRSVTFDAITEWDLPQPARWPNAITTSPDGSVWFGESAVPGVAHLFANGTLVEYKWPWPATPGGTLDCGYKANLWGIAAWNGSVWATSGDTNQIFSLDIQTGVISSKNASSPYILTVGPDNDMWFTMQTYSHGSIGKISPGGMVSTYALLNFSDYIPQQIQFINSTYAYFVAFDPKNNYASGLFTFNPTEVSGGIRPTRLGASSSLFATTGLSAGSQAVWITQHYASSVTSFDLSTRSFDRYPTSVENYTSRSTTLPYFVEANGTMVWFNEHYANKIGLFDTVENTLTEYSESRPPVSDFAHVQNDLTIGLAKDRLWFTSASGNYVGFASATYKPSFSLSNVGVQNIFLSSGQNTTAHMELTGNWTRSLSINVSDSEVSNSVPQNLKIVPTIRTLEAGRGPILFSVAISSAKGLAPGSYTVLITATDGMISRSTYVRITFEGTPPLSKP